MTDQAMNSRPMTVRAVTPNTRGSVSTAPRIIPLKVKAMEPMTQRSSVVIVDESFMSIFRVAFVKKINERRMKAESAIIPISLTLRSEQSENEAVQ